MKQKKSATKPKLKQDPVPSQTDAASDAASPPMAHASQQSKPAKSDVALVPVKAGESAAPFFSDLDMYLLREGTHLHLYDKLGSHLVERDGVKGTQFSVWAPNASRVSVVGDFNAWNGDVNVLAPTDAGIWHGFVAGVKKGDFYKFEIRNRDGALLPLKADPLAFFTERSPATASVVWSAPEIKRSATIAQGLADPVSIYEVHLGSWMRGLDNAMLTYKDLAAKLVSYAKEMGFTHLEFMPVSSYPFEGSWGYQPIGLFAPSNRYGTPEEFASLVEAAHAAGLGIITDWVPGHFPSDEHGLANFDGTHLYEYADPREGRHMDWDTLIYNYSRTEVANFLTANALFWLERYGVDGLRVDAVASMIYRNYSRKENEWLPNYYGGFENLEAVGLLKRINQEIQSRFPGKTTFAEESTAWPGVSRAVSEGGLGFGYKWNMGWMHDTLLYMTKDPIYRRYHHNLMTFGLIYAWTENFVLPLSHDEVVHGKRSLLEKMPGDDWQKFANLRAYYGFMFGHPGKKLMFMGSEFAQRGEWNHDRSLDWHLLDYKPHSGMQRLVRDLNHLYTSTPALFVRDSDPGGFEWLESSAEDVSVFAFCRRGNGPKDLIIVVSNMTPVVRYDYRVAVPEPGFYKECLNTDSSYYGGSNVGNEGGRESEACSYHGRAQSLSLTLPPLATIFLHYEG